MKKGDQKRQWSTTIYLRHSRLQKRNRLQKPCKRKQKIATVFNSSPVYAVLQRLKRLSQGKIIERLRTEKRQVMEGVNLIFEPGKMYLILGAPRSGKSTLLKMIAGTLQMDKDHKVGGTVSINSHSPSSRAITWSHLVGYIDQIDRLHPWLTVHETLEFSWRCHQGQTHRNPFYGEGEEIDAEVKKLDEGLHGVNAILSLMGLERVRDTFVGDQETVRGVSGGEKRRVTVAEMVVAMFPVLCADEISTGLDGMYFPTDCNAIADLSFSN